MNAGQPDAGDCMRTAGTLFETKGLFILVDTDKNRVYILLRAP